MRPNDTIYIEQTRMLERTRASAFGAKAFELCRGNGLEIGAVNCPFDLEADVTYVDQVGSVELLRRHEDDVNVNDVVPVTLISKELQYSFIADCSYDFVVASHVLEHTANPGRILREFSRILKPEGIIYLVVPHKDFCFDRNRNSTLLSTLAWKFYADVTKITSEEYLDFMFAMQGNNCIDESDAAKIIVEASRWKAEQLDFHVQTFTHETFWAFLAWIAPKVGCELIHKQWNELHIHGALRKLSF